VVPTDVLSEIDDLIRRHWASFIEGRCPNCEALIVLDLAEGSGNIDHDEKCPIRIGALEEFAEAWDVKLGVGYVDRITEGKLLRYAGPIRVPI
jgi:hypothetical protein